MDQYTKVSVSSIAKPVLLSPSGLYSPQGFDKFGFIVRDNGDIAYREWAPNAKEAYLTGDFSGWHQTHIEY